MDLVQAGILALVEGVTEFLPISSTGHLVLVSQLLGIPQTEFVKSFEIIIQLGAILAVVALYWRRILQNSKLWMPLLAAFIPTALLGLAFYKLIKDYLLGNSLVTVLALLVGGVVLIGIELLWKDKKNTRTADDISIKEGIIIGLFQSISMIPGVSRAAATIIGGMFMGLDRKSAVEFSFMLAIPTMAAATGLDLIKTNFEFTQNELTALIVGLVGSFVVALVAIKWLLRYVQNHTFIPFGIYRIVVAVLFLILMR
jgi:undecaprenyl-diphosphatase